MPIAALDQERPPRIVEDVVGAGLAVINMDADRASNRDQYLDIAPVPVASAQALGPVNEVNPADGKRHGLLENR